MKVGREPCRDPDRVLIARHAIGETVGLFVDANGAYDLKQALRMAERFAEHDVSWFEEPVSSDNLSGLALMVSSGSLHGDCGRVWIHSDVFPAHAGGARGGCAAGGRDPLRRHHRLSHRLRALGDGWDMPLCGAHRAHAARAPRLRLSACAQRRVLPRPCPHQRCCSTARSCPAVERSRPTSPWPGLGLSFKQADAERFAA